MSKDIPLHKRTHFRRIKEVLRELADYEGFNIRDYDIEKITAYESMGINMRGKNVSYNIKDGASCFVGDNHYDIFEISSLSNRKGSPYGEFLYLIYNKDFDYHLFGQVKVTLNAERSRSEMNLVEKVYYKNYGKYSIVFGNRENNIVKVEYGSQFDPGRPSSEEVVNFDSYNSRKKAYRTDRHKLLSSIGVRGLNSGKIKSDKAVEIYKKKNGKGRGPEGSKGKRKY